MKSMTSIPGALLALALLLVSFNIKADDKKTDKPIPYPLDTCAVCGMKLGDMGKPFTFVYTNADFPQGQEIKVCDKSEKADFDKDPRKYLKPIQEAEAKAKDKK
jgi:hypothetical protein